MNLKMKKQLIYFAALTTIIDDTVDPGTSDMNGSSY